MSKQSALCESTWRTHQNSVQAATNVWLNCVHRNWK